MFFYRDGSSFWGEILLPGVGKDGDVQFYFWWPERQLVYPRFWGAEVDCSKQVKSLVRFWEDLCLDL